MLTLKFFNRNLLRSLRKIMQRNNSNSFTAMRLIHKEKHSHTLLKFSVNNFIHNSYRKIKSSKVVCGSKQLRVAMKTVS